MPDGAENAALDSAILEGGSDHGRFPQTYTAAAGRLPLCLAGEIPHLTRSSLHRCLKRHAISRLPEIAGDKVTKKPFKRYPLGNFHLDIAEVRTKEGKLYLFVAIDRTSKFVFAHMLFRFPQAPESWYRPDRPGGLFPH